MDDLDKYIESRKKKSHKFEKDFDKGYEQFKIGVILKQARLEAGSAPPLKVIANPCHVQTCRRIFYTL